MAQGRNLDLPVLHTVSAKLEYSDWSGTGAKILLGHIPAGSLYKGAIIDLDTSFVASTASASLPIFEIGDSSNDSFFVSGTDIDECSASYYTPTTNRGTLAHEHAVYAKLSTGAAAAFPTQGVVHIVLEYMPPSDNKRFNATFD
jgi:hypothetical protein